MYKKIASIKDDRIYDQPTAIYSNGDNYLIIICERGENSYFFVDHERERIYAANKYFKSRGIKFNLSEPLFIINRDFDYDFASGLYSPCPEYYKKLIGGSVG